MKPIKWLCERCKRERLQGRVDRWCPEPKVDERDLWAKDKVPDWCPLLAEQAVSQPAEVAGA